MWSPDGIKFAFTSWDAENKVRNWVADVKGKKAEEVKLPKVKTEESGECQVAVEDWSPDGRWFAAAGDGIHLVKTDGSTARRLTRIRGGGCRFSPDGRKVLFVGDNVDRSETLYVVEVAGGKPRPVVQAKNFTDIRACWSPDGRRIAYTVVFLDVGGQRVGESNLNVVNVDGTNSATLVAEKHEPEHIRLVLLGWR